MSNHYSLLFLARLSSQLSFVIVHLSTLVGCSSSYSVCAARSADTTYAPRIIRWRRRRRRSREGRREWQEAGESHTEKIKEIKKRSGSNRDIKKSQNKNYSSLRSRQTALFLISIRSRLYSLFLFNPTTRKLDGIGIGTMKSNGFRDDAAALLKNRFQDRWRLLQSDGSGGC